MWGIHFHAVSIAQLYLDLEDDFRVLRDFDVI